MRRWMLPILTLVLMHVDAGAQTTDAGTPPQDTLTGNATGAAGASAGGAGLSGPVPLTARERFRLYLTGTYTIAPLFESAAGAGIQQRDNDPKEWKQGAAAYGKRFGSIYATLIIQDTLEYGASAVLHEDNRYVRSLDTGFFKRSGHAIASTFEARNDAGARHFAYSRFAAAMGAAFISRIWQPHSENRAGDAGAAFGYMIATDAGENLLHEFWPDIKHHLFKKKQ